MHAALQEPSPTPSIDSQITKKNSAESDEKTAANPQGTAENPLIIKRLDAEETPERREQQATEREEKATNERRLVFWTLILAVLTGALTIVAGVQVGMFWIQLKMMRKATQDAGDAAKAALESARASKTLAQTARDEFISTHRPNIRLKHIFLDSDIWKEDGVRIRMAIVNTGVNSAHIREANVAILFLRDGDDLPQVPRFSEATKVGPIDMAMANGQTFVFPKGWEMSADDSLSIGFNSVDNSTALMLYCFGYVDYADSTGTVSRKTAFCRVMKIPEKGKQITRFKEPEEKNTDYEYQD